MRQDGSRGEALILDLLARHAAEPYTLEDLAAMLPELSWAELFQAVDRLSRRRLIILSRQGFNYLLVYPDNPEKQAELVMVGSASDNQ
jgi:hypothetical protein